MDLELGHVGNPIAETTDEASDEALVVLPPQMQRFGKLLSTPTGRPTPACWLIGAVLALYPLAGLLVGVGIPSVLSRAVDGDTQLAIQFGLIYGGVLAAGPVALHALFMVTRQPQGHLTQLGAGTARVPRGIVDGLEWWARFLKGLASLMVFLIAAFDGLFASLGLVLSAATGFAYFACFFSTLFLWWYSLKVASALTAAPVAVANDKARAVATWLREDGGSMDLQTWRPEVEAPVLELVRNTLPTLSDGWGRSVGVIMIGLVCFALGLFLALKANFAIGTALWLQAVCAGLIGGLVSLPFLLAIDPASASSNCARLEDSINHIGGEDSSFMPAENFIKYIKRVNKDQGLGFVVFGQVMTKRTLWVGASAFYGMMVAFGPTLLGEAGLASTCGAGGSQHASCDFGWTFADGACFKLFGDGIMGEPLGWAAAEEACQEMGSQTHLASVTSEEQQRAVQHLALAAGVQVWIGLNDVAESGNFVWSDGEPLEYTNWEAAEGPRTDEKTIVIDEPGGWDDWGGMFPYICAKKATPTFASGGEMNGCTGGRWVMGTPYKQPRFLSIRLAPTIVYDMFKQKVYDEIAPQKVALNETITTAAECAAVVHRDYEAANAAVYSNVGREECWAVFKAAGVIYDPALQTCVFEQ